MLYFGGAHRRKEDTFFRYLPVCACFHSKNDNKKTKSLSLSPPCARCSWLPLYNLDFVSFKTYYFEVETKNDLHDYTGLADPDRLEDWIAEVSVSNVQAAGCFFVCVFFFRGRRVGDRKSPPVCGVSLKLFWLRVRRVDGR